MNRYAELKIALSSLMEEHGTPGMSVAVLQGGQIAWSEGLGTLERGNDRPVARNSLFHACSMSKMVTALGVLRLVQQERLRLDADVNEYLESWKLTEGPNMRNSMEQDMGHEREKDMIGDRGKEVDQHVLVKHMDEVSDQRPRYQISVTLSQLLAHQGGLEDPECSFDACRPDDQVPELEDILAGRTRYLQQPLKVSYVPESRFSYSDAGYCVIELIVEQVTGLPFAEAMDELVIGPLGLRYTSFWNSAADPEGRTLPMDIEGGCSIAAGHNAQGSVVPGRRAYYPYQAAAGLWTTAEDLARMLAALMEAWHGESVSLLRPDLVRYMLTGFGCEPAAGMGVFLHSADDVLQILSRGWGIGFQGMLTAFPERGVGVVVLTNMDPGRPQQESVVGAAIREIARACSWPGSQG
ncbi:serine hydrolase domain-containing protein [Paenibacillus massiliensis]|uniref:serine hydrolase domain-containing protein n=1 Tax=Paenibacillus massiliensis TaxID=225917 RepID=UPI0003FEC1D8|nr:serine hydrolase domain-containing protein [Paenibacillus massiliensis]